MSQNTTSDLTVTLSSEKAIDNKDICEVIDTLESLLTSVKPKLKDGYTETTIWISSLSSENRKEVEDKIMEMVRKIK